MVYGWHAGCIQNGQLKALFMKLFRFKTKVLIPGKPVPSEFVDWYRAETQAEAQSLYDEDLHRYGLSAEQTNTEICECNLETLKPL